MNDEPAIYDILKSTYGNNKSKNTLEKFGYKYDTNLSNDNESVYFNSKTNKLIYGVAGTHNLNDIGTDVVLAFGGLKNTNRYKEANDVYKKAKDKYNPSHSTVYGHSLGGAIASYIAGSNDDVITFNKAATLGQSHHKNEKSYRTLLDPVSLLSPNTKTIIGNTNNYNPLNGVFNNLYNSHNLENIKFV